MKKKIIVFTSPGVARLLEEEMPPLGAGEVLTKTEYTVVSGGTERACLMGSTNTAASGFPCRLGYAGVGRVIAVGEGVDKVSVGDRVLVYHGNHSDYNVRPQQEIIRVDDDRLKSEDLPFIILAVMGLGGVRKTEVEIGESGLVMGLGLLGLFSVQFMRAAGAYPVITADPNPARRDLALRLGADFALDPTAADFHDRVMDLTAKKGVKAVVEVTGAAVALKECLSVTSFMGRIALLGCTRVSDCPIDFYRDVHKPGIKLIGAHNFVRPKSDSAPHLWTHEDDCRAAMALLGAGRISVSPLRSRIVRPEDCTEVYRELATDPDFKVGTVFDWNR